VSAASNLRRTSVKLALFVAVTTLLGVMIVSTLVGKSVGPTDSYHAIFGDVSGLHTGDTVRVSGVVVGQVTSEKLIDANHVRVTFTANHNQQLTSTTNAVVRYANLLGQRFLALTEGDSPGTTLHPGGTIPQAQTAPALSLTALFNGFRPLFQSLQPDQINQLAGEIVQILQGEGGTIGDLFAQTAQLTTDVGQRDTMIKGIVDGLGKVLSTVAGHDAQLRKVISSLKSLTGTLAADSPDIDSSLSGVDKLLNSVDDLLGGLRQHNFDNDAIDLNAIAGVIAKNSSVLDATIQAFPKAFGTFDVVTQTGNWINAYPCVISGAIVGTPTASPTQIATLIGDYLGGGNAVKTVVLNLIGGLLPGGVPVPLKIPTGAVGNPNTHSAVCR
jgi:phospholipid/cholesterol/gamma-HCH transport system substrate-binding protein